MDNILNKNDVDYELENFWMTYKLNLKNFYKIYPSFYRPINEWSIILNNYKKNKKYNMIQKKITYFLTLHIVDTMKSFDNYYSGILKTNINRWIKVSKLSIFLDVSEELNRLDQLFRIYYKMLNSDKICKNLFYQAELLIFYKDYTPLIIYAINNNKGSILDKLNNIYDITTDILELYNKIIYKNTKGDKIIKTIRS